jgi:hypothetical protein
MRASAPSTAVVHRTTRRATIFFGAAGASRAGWADASVVPATSVSPSALGGSGASVTNVTLSRSLAICPGKSHSLDARSSYGRQGSGYEEAEAKLCRVEADQVAVALGPPA